MNKVGIRTKRRREINVRLKKMWLEQGIMSCELRLPGICLGTFAMGAAHAKKSRFLQSDPDWMTAVLACAACHEYIEKQSHAVMERIVLDTIARRGTIE